LSEKVSVLAPCFYLPVFGVKAGVGRFLRPQHPTRPRFRSATLPEVDEVQ
jgi:hypothetical protein